MFGVDPRVEPRTGDLLFCDGRYAVSSIVRTITRSRWSHVGLILMLEGRPLLLESLEPQGVRLMPLDAYIRSYRGDMVIGRVQADIIPQHLIDAGLSRLGDPYNLADVAMLALRFLLGIGRPDIDDHAYLCSELVAACWQDCGVILGRTPSGFVTPGSLFADPQIEIVAQIR